MAKYQRYQFNVPTHHITKRNLFVQNSVTVAMQCNASCNANIEWNEMTQN